MQCDAGSAPGSGGVAALPAGVFYDAALPSVAAQEEAGFEWLVLFDDRCPDTFRRDVEDLAADGAFTPLWSHDVFRRNSFAGPVAGIARSTHLITTRMDSDDAIARDFMASVQQQFDGQDLLFVNFLTGLQVDRSGAVYRSDQVSGPFLSLIERRTAAPPLTVYGPKHARARSVGPLRQVVAGPMWVQVVHGSNLSNIVNGARVSPSVPTAGSRSTSGTRGTCRARLSSGPGRDSGCPSCGCGWTTPGSSSHTPRREPPGCGARTRLHDGRTP